MEYNKPKSIIDFVKSLEIFYMDPLKNKSSNHMLQQLRLNSFEKHTGWMVSKLKKMEQTLIEDGKNEKGEKEKKKGKEKKKEKKEK